MTSCLILLSYEASDAIDRHSFALSVKSEGLWELGATAWNLAEMAQIILNERKVDMLGLRYQVFFC